MSLIIIIAGKRLFSFPRYMALAKCSRACLTQVIWPRAVCIGPRDQDGNFDVAIPLGGVGWKIPVGDKSSVIGVVKDGGARYFSIGIVQCSCVHTGAV